MPRGRVGSGHVHGPPASDRRRADRPRRRGAGLPGPDLGHPGAARPLGGVDHCGAASAPGCGWRYALWLVLVDPRRRARPRGRPRRSSPAALGFRVHRIMATLIGGHTAYDGTGTTAGTPRRGRGVRPRGQPRSSPASVGSGSRSPPGRSRSSPGRFAVMNLLLAGFNLLPGLPLDGGAVVQSVVWRVSGRRDLGTRVAGWAGRAVAVGVVLWFGVRPLALGERADLRPAHRPRHGLDPLAGRQRGPGPRAARAAAARRAARGRARAGARGAGRPRRSASSSAPRTRCSPSTSATCPRSWLPSPEAGAPDLATLPPQTRLASVVVRLPDAALVDLPPGGDLEPVLRAMSGTGWGLVVVSEGRRVRGVVTSAHLDAVAQQALRRN